MPSSATITSFTTFVANTKARASEVNTNFSNFRGHVLPIDPNTVAAADNTYALGSEEYRWSTVYANTVSLGLTTAPYTIGMTGGFFYIFDPNGVNALGVGYNTATAITTLYEPMIINDSFTVLDNVNVGLNIKLTAPTNTGASVTGGNIVWTSGDTSTAELGLGYLRGVFPPGFLLTTATYTTLEIRSGCPPLSANRYQNWSNNGSWGSNLKSANIYYAPTGNTTGTTLVPNSTITGNQTGRPILFMLSANEDTNGTAVVNNDYGIMIFENGSNVMTMRNPGIGWTHLRVTGATSATWDLRWFGSASTSGGGSLLLLDVAFYAIEL